MRGQVDLKRPEGAIWGGYAALVEMLKLDVPLRRGVALVSGSSHRPPRPFAGDPRVTIREERGRTATDPVAALRFALAREEPDLLVLRKAIHALGEQRVCAAVRAAPTSEPMRRLWAYAEFFLDMKLDIAPVRVASIDLVERDRYHVVAGLRAPGSGVVINLPGGPDFCPLVARAAGGASSARIQRHAAALFGAQDDPDFRRRAEAWLIAADRRATYEIEGEKAVSSDLATLERAARRVAAGPLDANAVESMQRAFFERVRAGDATGLRAQAGEEAFVGRRGPDQTPIPEHVGARGQDVPALMKGLFAFWEKTLADREFDPLVRAACLSFGFAQIHPYRDGVGKLHRFLLEEALARGAGVRAPFAMAIQADIAGYRAALRAMREPILDRVDWTTTEKHGLRILSDSGDFYRFPQLDEAVGFCTRAVERALCVEAPDEIDMLRRHDAALEEIRGRLRHFGSAMRVDQIDMAVTLARENGGRIGADKRRSLFEGFDAAALDMIEAVAISHFRRQDAEAFGPSIG